MGNVNGNRVERVQVRNPLYGNNNEETPPPDRNAEPEPRRLALGGVMVALANRVRDGLSLQTKLDLEQALIEDIYELFGVQEENAVAKLVASTLSEGLNRPPGRIYGVITETPRGRLLERVGLRKNPGLGGKEEYHRRVFEESRKRRSLGDLVENISSAEALEALQAVLRDRARRTTIRETAASIEIDCLAKLSSPTSAQVRSAILAGLKLAFPEASEDDWQEQLQEIAGKAGWDMTAAGILRIYDMERLQSAFHGLICKDVDTRVILGQFGRFRELDTFVEPALIVEKVLAGLGKRLEWKLPLEAGDLSSDQRKALEGAFKDRHFKETIREQVVTDAIMRHFSDFKDNPRGVVNKVLFRLKLPLRAGTLKRNQLKKLAKNLEDPKFTAAMQRQVEADPGVARRPGGASRDRNIEDLI